MTVHGTGVASQASYRPGMDRRRFLLTSLAGAVAGPLAADAQTGRSHQITCVERAKETEEYQSQVQAQRVCGLCGERFDALPSCLDARECWTCAAMSPSVRAALPNFPSHILITGAPVSGKTYFTQWLGSRHGFRVLRFDSGTPAKPSRTGRSEAAAVTIGDRVAIDWNFSPEALTPMAAVLNTGFEGWFLNVEVGPARHIWLQDRNRDPRDFDRNLNMIQERLTDLQAVFQDRWFPTLSGSSRLPVAWIHACIAMHPR